jgi:hypothetical protein
VERLQPTVADVSAGAIEFRSMDSWPVGQPFRVLKPLIGVEHVSREVVLAEQSASPTRAVGTEPAVERDAVLDLLFRAHYASLLRLARVLIGSRATRSHSHPPNSSRPEFGPACTIAARS